jgi:hypothetical protein
VQYAASEMRRYSTDRSAQAHFSVQYAGVKCGYTAAVLIHYGEAYPIESSHKAIIPQIRSLSSARLRITALCNACPRFAIVPPGVRSFSGRSARCLLNGC